MIRCSDQAPFLLRQWVSKIGTSGLSRTFISAPVVESLERVGNIFIREKIHSLRLHIPFFRAVNR